MSGSINLNGKRGKVRRMLMSKMPKITENVKKVMLLKGTSCSNLVFTAMKEMAQYKKPDVVQLQKKNEIRPFEDHSSLEFLSNKNDCSLFMLGSNSKKRPHNITIGRFFDFQVLDMIELGIVNFKSMVEFDAEKAPVGNKPCLIFQGEEFGDERNREAQTVKNMFLDFFRGIVVDKINLAGMEHVIVVSSKEKKIYFRVYKILLKKSGTKIPRVELQEMGPSIDFNIGRLSEASSDVLKIAYQVPKEDKIKKEKNIEVDTFAVKGRIHMQRQDVSEMATRKMKAFKRKSDSSEQRTTKKNKVDKEGRM